MSTTASFPTYRFAGLARSRLRTAAFAGAVVLAEIAAGMMLVDPRFNRLALLPFAAAGMALVFAFPFAATIALLVATASIIPAAVFAIGLGPIDLRLEELLLGALLIVAILKPRRAWWGGRAGGALAAFLALVALSAVVAMGAGRVSFGEAFGSARPLGLLTLFYIVVRLFPDPHDMHRLLTATVVLCAVSGVVALLSALPGSPVADLLPKGEGTASVDAAEGGGLVRVRLPAVMLTFALFWYAAVRWAAAEGRQRIGWALVVSLMGLSIVLSFNRNMWLGLAVGLCLMLALGRQGRRRAFSGALLAVAAASLIVALWAPKVSDDSPLYPVVERGATLLDPGRTRSEDSLNQRAQENRFAVAAIEEHPLLGVGAGAPFGRRATEVAANGITKTRLEQLWVHNQYLHILLIAGGLGLAAFVAFIGTVVSGAVGRLLQDDRVLALAVALVAILLSAIVMIYVVNPTAAVTLGLLCGALVVLTSAPPASRMSNA